MNHKQLLNQLKSNGITKAVAEKGTSEGYPAIWLRWNGDSEVFTGTDEHNPHDPMAARIQRFKDSNLK